MSRLIDPVIADLQSEYAEAVGAGRMCWRCWVRLSGYVAFLKVFVVCDWSWNEDTRPLLRTVGSVFGAIAVFTIALGAPALTRYWSGPVAVDRWTLTMCLIPQALAMSIPLGVMHGVAIGLARQRVSMRLATALVAAALVASIGSVANLGWIMPNANQAFRVAMLEGLSRDRRRQDLLPQLERGTPEMTFGELGRGIQAFKDYPLGSHEWLRAFELRLQYHSRWSMAFASLTLALFSIALVASTQRRRLVSAGVVAGVFLYYFCMYFGRRLALQGDLSPLAAAWLPHVLMVLATSVLMIRGRLAATEHAR